MSHPHPDNPNILLYYARCGRDVVERVVKYSPVGSYPVFYVTADGGVLSAEAVEDNLDDCCNPEDRGWFVAGHDANWENPDLYCDVTGERIESAYAEEEE